MTKAKRYLLKAREYLSNFKKVEKKGGPPKLKVTTKKTVNLAVIGGISFLLFVGLMGSVRAITLSNKVGTLQDQVEATQKQKAQPIDANRKYDYKLQYYLNDYVYAYFTLPQEGDKQQAQVEHLNSFYNFVPDVKAQGQVRNPSTLLYSQLVTVEGKVATYKVKYKEIIQHDKDTEEKNWSRGLIFPLMKKRGNTTFLDFLGSQRLTLHKLDTLAKTINSNSQPTTTSQTVNTRRLKSSSRFSLPTTPLTKTISTSLLRTLLL
ncbi:hypothetical protein HSISS2_1357 [Streptococcus sp. HSISS2]|nr:hypothetical protein HSISS2_1357 [Streptococcus sp. HSISS2]